MNKGLKVVVAMCMVAGLCVMSWSQTQRGYTVLPPSSVERSGDVGSRAHTNHVVQVRPGFTGTSPSGETPASLACVYHLVNNLVTGCPISGTSTNPSGGSGIVAIVDAFDYVTAENDLNVFSSTFNLPTCTTNNGCFTKLVLGTRPRRNCGWAQEAALDIEWAHAMAPSAKIVLVEAATNRFTDLLTAVDVATQYIQQHGGNGEVSMSWGGSEFPTESTNDFHFIPPTGTNIVYVGASGDTGDKAIYPSASPDVVAAGGTSVNRDGFHLFTGETAWSGSGGGPSLYESRPTYQNNISTIVNNARGVPDFSFDADPNTGVSVYDSTSCQGLSGWLVFGGTSVASPSLAGIVNLAGHFSTTSVDELTTIYGNLGNSSDFRDITSGTAGSFSATTGWDFVTGIGSDQGLSGK